MKKFFILASAAIVALASCAKTEVVYKDAPEEIAFKAVNVPMTKAGNYDQALKVSAYVISDKTTYFDQVTFTASNGLWTGGKYWPLDTKLGFVAYGPAVENLATQVEVSTTKITAKGVKSDIDFVYSGYVDGEDDKGYGKGDVVPMTLYHTKAKVVVNVTTAPDGNENVTKIELTDAKDGGNCAVTFPSTIAWEGQTDKTFEYNASPNNVHYVVPSTPGKLVITYNSVSPSKTGLTAEINLANETMYDANGQAVVMSDGWKAGYSYTYNVAISSSLITIEASAEPWVEVTNTQPAQQE